MKEQLKEGILYKALGSSWPYDLVYFINAKEALRFYRENKGKRRLSRMFVLKENNRVCWLPYSKKVIKLSSAESNLVSFYTF